MSLYNIDILDAEYEEVESDQVLYDATNADADYSAVAGVYGPDLAAWNEDLKDEVHFGVALAGSMLGALTLGLILGGRSRIVAALAGAAGAAIGGFAFKAVGDKVITFKRKATDAVTKPITPPTTTPTPTTAN